ncbi:MAG: hypothetical protein JNM56_24585 [Planctomycetia bacterium]|nr:hypothetical protein [Planctomycetia bacterium]
MEITVLVEPVLGNGFRAGALGLSVEGHTRDQALNNLKEALLQRTAAGAEIVKVTLAARPPWGEFAGDLRDDPMFDDWVQAMADYRREKDRALEE